MGWAGWAVRSPTGGSPARRFALPWIGQQPAQLGKFQRLGQQSRGDTPYGRGQQYPLQRLARAKPLFRPVIAGVEGGDRRMLFKPRFLPEIAYQQAEVAHGEDLRRAPRAVRLGRYSVAPTGLVVRPAGQLCPVVRPGTQLLVGAADHAEDQPGQRLLSKGVAAALVDVAAGAQLVVVGAHGRRAEGPAPQLRHPPGAASRTVPGRCGRLVRRSRRQALADHFGLGGGRRVSARWRAE